MTEGTVTITIREFDNYRLFEKAVKERQVVGVRNSYDYMSTYTEYFLTTESQALIDAKSVLEKADIENYELRSKIRDLNNNIKELLSRKEPKKWWQT
jgi:dsDNA-specific endonuclease/ATPase MutS2